MSHNISCKMDCSMEKLADPAVQSILEQEFKWKVLPKGKYRGYYGSEQEIDADMRIAIPASQATAYGERLSPQEAAQYGLTGEYKVIAIKNKVGKVVKKRNERGMMEAVQEPSSVEVIMDQGSGMGVKPEDVTKKIQHAVQGAEVISQILAPIYAAFPAGGDNLSIAENQVRKQVVEAIVKGTPMKVRLDFVP